VVGQALSLEQHLLDEFRTWVVLIQQQTRLPIFPTPAELEVAQVVREPVDKSAAFAMKEMSSESKACKDHLKGTV
jgi:hypothetical protein